METRANYGLIGLFTLVVAGIAFGMIYWVGRLDQSGASVDIQVSFPGAVVGLAPGSSAMFNGIRIGTVRKLSLDPKNPEVVIVDVEMAQDAPLKSDTAITLATFGLTGASYVDFRGGSKDAPFLLMQDNIPVLQADSSSMDDLLQTARAVMGRVDKVARRVDELVETNSLYIDRTLKNVAEFSDALASNSDGINNFLATTSKTAEEISILAQSLKGLSEKAGTLMDAVEPETVANAVSNIEKFSENLNATSGKLELLIGDAREAVSTFSAFGTTITSSVEQVDGILAAVSPEDIKGVIADLRGFTKSLGLRATDIETILTNAREGSEKFRSLADTVAGEGDNITRISRNAAEFTEKLNSAATRFDGFFDSVGGLLDSEGSEGVVAEFSKTMQSIRSAAASFDVRLGEISNGVARFSGKGLRNLEQLISEGRRAVGRMDRILQQFENNPRQFISGGGGIPEYNGRPRR